MDFTIITYRRLLEALLAQGYILLPFNRYLEDTAGRKIILRHDVDTRPEYSLRFARIQKELGITGSYYFRMVPQSYNEEIIREIAGLGHEIGYHYETMDTCRGDVGLAIKEFEKNLASLRTIAPITTICMHGSPLSKWDNRDLWSGVGQRAKGLEKTTDLPDQNGHSTLNTPHSTLNIHYRDFGILGEPYFDVDFSNVLYLTDTGRRWDGGAVSVRDKVGPPHPLYPPAPYSPSPNWRGGKGVRFHSTSDIIAAANAGLLPDQIMMTFHPQRWTDRPLPWLQELLVQNLKNVAKRILISRGRRAKGRELRAASEALSS